MSNFPFPRKVSLVRQTHEALVQGMQEGHWKGVLPGERILSTKLRVSRGTLRAAMNALAKEGILKIVHGRPCVIDAHGLKGARRPRSSGHRVALLVPAPLSHMRQFVALWVDELRAILGEQGFALDVVAAPGVYCARPAVALQRLVKTHRHDAWLLVLSNRAMQEWFEARKLPAIVTGTCYDGIRLPSVDIESHGAGVHAAHLVYRLGHRRVALLMPSSAFAGALAIREGLRSALAKARPEPATLEVKVTAETNADICKATTALFGLLERPTVLITCRAGAALTVSSHLSRMGIRIPGQLSLLSMEWEPFLAHLVPEIACYRIRPLRFAQRTAHVLSRRLELPDFQATASLEPEFVAGDSLATVR